MISASAPGRCGIVGNPSDIYGGSVLSCTTRERAHCQLTDETSTMTIALSGTEMVVSDTGCLESSLGDPLRIPKAVLKALEVDPCSMRPFHLSAWSDIPVQAGLAGSTALLACITGAVLAHLQIRLTRYQTAELIRKIEYDVLGVVCGYQDHYMTVFGGLNFMDFRHKAPGDYLGDDTPFATVEPLEQYVPVPPLVLAHTGVRHDSGTIHGSIRDRWISGDHDAVQGNLDIAALARTAKRAALICDWSWLGSQMNENHAIQRRLGGSAESNEELIRAALASGAWGAKLAGAGGGGTIIALSPDPAAMAAALTAAGAEAILYPAISPGLVINVR